MGILTESVAREREQLIQDCRLPSGWELMIETLSLEGKDRTLTTVASTSESGPCRGLYVLCYRQVVACEAGGGFGVGRDQLGFSDSCLKSGWKLLAFILISSLLNAALLDTHTH